MISRSALTRRAAVMLALAWGCGITALLAAAFGLQGLLYEQSAETLLGAALAVIFGWGAQLAHVSHTALRRHLDDA